jgi:Family of unknown function (DUF6062)
VSRSAHHRLVEACARPGCPVCGCLRDVATRHLAALLAEHVTDPVSRARLAEAWGFCAAHASALHEMPEAALGTAIVYHALVERACRWLDEAARDATLPARRHGWRALVRGSGRTRSPARRRRARCPVCVELVVTETSHLDALLYGLAEPPLGPAYAGSDGLCLPHLDLALARGGARPGVARLVALSREKLRALASDLKQFVDKHDHRIPRPSFTEREAGAWRQALGLVAGRMELFGPEMEREGQGNGAAASRPRRAR